MSADSIVDPAAELASAHVWAADFGSVLEWCALRTDQLFEAGHVAEWRRAQIAQGSWDARRVERSMSREVS